MKKIAKPIPGTIPSAGELRAACKALLVDELSGHLLSRGGITYFVPTTCLIHHSFTGEPLDREGFLYVTVRARPKRSEVWVDRYPVPGNERPIESAYLFEQHDIVLDVSPPGPYFLAIDLRNDYLLEIIGPWLRCEVSNEW
jgi:hypothetical protein